MSDTETRVLTMSPRTPPCCAGDTDVTTQDAEPTPEQAAATVARMAKLSRLSATDAVQMRQRAAEKKPPAARARP